MEQFNKERSQERIDQSKSRVQSAPELTLIGECLPERFEFFHYGKIESTTKAIALSDLAECPFVVSFRVVGDEVGTCFLGFDRLPSPMDESMACEIGNILVGKLCDGVSERNGVPVEMYPPEIVRTPDDEAVNSKHRHLLSGLKNARDAQAKLKRYEFVGLGERIGVRFAYLSSTTQQTGQEQ